ncbi:DUF1456 family protein [Peribacillus sp. SCS-155]|uniref:DUF1456 family protein n=1 Tax=Peribacillus sedimenti TaxID=3115297 RepID=UPI003905D21E
MENNDILIRLRYAMDIKDVDMAEIFKLGGIEVTKEEVRHMLIKSNDDDPENEDQIKVNNKKLESFLHGFITFKRGKQEPKTGQAVAPAVSSNESINNLLLKKVKIALALTREDMLDIFEKAGVRISKGELSALLRKADHKNYKECGDKFARNFLKGLTIKYRG